MPGQADKYANVEEAIMREGYGGVDRRRDGRERKGQV